MARIQEAPKTSVSLERLSKFFYANRLVLLSSLVLVATLVIGYFVFAEIQKGRIARATFAAEVIQAEHARWRNEESQEIKVGFEQILLARMAQAIRKYPRLYAAQRSYYVRGSLFFEKGEWALAAEDFAQLSASFPRSYLAPLSLFNAAVCQEMLAIDDAAIQYYLRVPNSYPDNHLAAHALFSVGRLHEQDGNKSAAVAAYARIEDDYAASDWAKMAKNRVIYLRAQDQADGS